VYRKKRENVAQLLLSLLGSYGNPRPFPGAAPRRRFRDWLRDRLETLFSDYEDLPAPQDHEMAARGTGHWPLVLATLGRRQADAGPGNRGRHVPTPGEGRP
jgi:hypothetical protein